MHFTEKDIYALVKTFFNSESIVIVLDPGEIVIKNFPCDFVYITTKKQIEELALIKTHFVLINITGARAFGFPLNYNLVDGVLSFAPLDEAETGYFHYEICFINDVRDNLRWLFSANHKVNDFMDELEDPTSSIDVNNLFSLYPYIINYIRLKSGKIRKISDGNFHIYKRSGNLIPHTDDDFYESFSVNLYKYIDSGFLFFKFYAQKQWKAILKFAFNDSGLNLIDAEYLILSKFEKLKGTGLLPEDWSKNPDSLLFTLNTVSGELDYYQTSRHLDQIISGFNELTGVYQNEIKINEFLRKENLLALLNIIQLSHEQNLLPKGLSPSVINSLLDVLLNLLNSLDLNATITVSIAPGAISPDNMTFSNHRVVLFNWAFSTFNLPVLSDLFAYLFIHIESFENPDPEILVKKINKIKNSGILDSLISQYRLDFDLYLKLFIIRRAILETSAILDKKVIRPEINLKIILWIDTAEKLLNC